MHENRHNGWYNYQTWLAYCWLTNDYNTNEFMHEIAEAMGKYDFSKYLEDWLEEQCADTLSEANLICDLLRASLAEVNTLEIAEAFCEE